MASRNDVARMAGVSPAVVSYVLNNSNYVSQEKRKAVLDAVERLNYQPSYFGKMLQAGRTNNFALICDDIRGELFTEIAYHMEQAAYKKGYNIFLCNSHRSHAFLEGIASHKFDGIFIATSVYSTEEINYLAQAGIPVVLYVARDYEELDPRVSRIAVDYENGARLLTDRMLKRGIERIAFFPPYQSAIRHLGTKDFRMAGYRKALEESGRRVDEELISYENDRYDAIFAKAVGLCCAARDNGERIGLIVGSDYLAVRIINELTDKGLYDTNQVAVAGMDYTACATMTRPVLTTIGFSKETIARTVVEQLSDRTANQQRRGKTILIPTFLVEGGSA